MLNIPTQVNNVTCLQDVEFNSLADEAENLITGSGQTLSGLDLNQFGKSVAIYAGGGDFYTDSGVVNAYVLSPIGTRQSPPSYEDGMRVRFLTTNANTGPSTVDVNSNGPADICDFDGVTPLVAGKIPADRHITLAYDAANSCFRLIDVADVTASTAQQTLIAFDQAALVGNNYDAVHGITQYVNYTVYDNNDTEVDVGAVATNATTLTLDLTGLTPITGTWRVKVVG